MTKVSEAAAKKQAADNKQNQGAQNATEKVAAEKEAAEKEAEATEATPAKEAEEQAATVAEEKPANSVKAPAVENVDYFIDKPKPAITFERDGVKYRLRGQVFHISGTRITAAELVLPENKAILDKLFEMKSAIIQEAFE